MVATFVRLKLAILANRMRQALRRPERVIVTVLVFVMFLGSRALADANSVVWLFNASSQPDSGADRAIATALVLAAGWAVLPMLASRRASVPIEPLVVLPLRPRQIVAGLWFSGLVGAGAAATAALLGVLSASYRNDGSALAVAILASLALLVQVTVLGRMMISIQELGARSRHPRRSAALITLAVVALGALAAGAAYVALRNTGTERWYVHLVEWSPPGLLGRSYAEAVTGDTWIALAMIAGSSVVTAVLWATWVWVIARRLEAGAPSAVARAAAGDPFARFARRGPAGRLGAIAARERAMFFRSARVLSSTIVYVGAFGGILAALVASAAPDGYAPLAAMALAFPLTVRRVNQVSARARGRWLSVVSPGPRWADVAGFDLAFAPFDVGLIVGTAIVVSTVTDSWDLAAPAALLGVAVWLVGQAVVHVTSFLFVQPQSWDSPDDAEAASPNLVQTMTTMAAFFVGVIPVVGLVVLGVADGGTVSMLVVVPVSVAYGVVLWWVSLRWTASWLERNEADLQAQLRA